MRNIRYLSKHIDAKQSTEYAVFFEHDGFYARLDWELADSAAVDPALIDELMLDQLAADLNDEQTIAEIREANKRSNSGDRLQLMLTEGYTEQTVPDFKQKAVDRFGDK